jgi:N-acetylmuramoyl-L-alanine amidase
MKPLSYQTVIAAVTRLFRAQRSFAWRCAALLVLALGLASLSIVWRAPLTQGSPEFAQAQAQTRGLPRVSAITASQAAEATIVTIRLDQAIKYRFFALPTPSPRLVIDMPRVNWGLGNGKAGTLIGEGGVSQIRFADKSQSESRIVLDLTGPMRVRKHEIVGVLGGRQLRLELVPTNPNTFAATAPLPKPRAVEKVNSVPTPIRPNPSGKRFVIVIDPGHGGKDPGAPGVSGTLFEKEVTLASAILLRDYLRRDRRFEVILTRDSDVFLTLERRILIARDKRADLFISLHADSAPAGSRAVGATVYTLSEAGGQRARQLLNNDNWSIAQPNQTQDKSVMEILRDLTQRDTKNQSAIFGQSLIGEIRNVGPVTQTSHRRAGFFVLLSPRVPAVLLEMGFMSHPEDEARLRNPQFRSRQMAATAKSISAYFDRVQMISGGATK